ncbi:unnamed protein product [Clonostachys solani]|uniref:Uncharacterized protein n=1 Tax=Clonostachys solani TaxID=160281 RepID=A0A9P0ETR9_9HYPO|nr:unnamed protein product [Clonostachys solani]
MESIDGRIPLCVAIRNGEDDVAISLLQHYPGRSLQPAAPHHEWAESLDRSLLRLGMSPLNDRYLKYCGKFLTQSLVILLLFQVPDVFFFKVSESPAVYIISTLVTEISYLLVRKCYENLSFHATVVGAQAIDAFLDSESQSERLLLELLDRGPISSNSASLDQLWGVAADKGYAEATRRLAALRSAPESDNTRTAVESQLDLYETADIEAKNKVDDRGPARSREAFRKRVPGIQYLIPLDTV